MNGAGKKRKCFPSGHCDIPGKAKEAQIMKDFIKNIVTVLGIVLMLAISFYGWMAYETRFKITYIGTEQSPEGEAQVIFQMLGEPAADLFGSSADRRDATNGRVIVKRGDEEIKTVEFSLSNEGEPLSKDNWEVDFYPAGVEILLTGASGQEKERIVVYYDGSEGSGEDMGRNPTYSEEEIIAEITARYDNQVSFLEERDGRYYFQADGFEFSAANDMQITDDYEESYYTYQVRRYGGNRIVELEKTVDENGVTQYEAVLVGTYGRAPRAQESFCNACCDIVENTQALIGYQKIGYYQGEDRRYFELAPYLENYDRVKLYNDMYLALEEDSLKAWQTGGNSPDGNGAASDAKLKEMPEEWKDYKEDCAYRKKDGTQLRMVGVDRAAGSSFYVLLKAENGVNSSVVNWDPYLGSGGGAAWIDFLEDEMIGFSCLAYNGGSLGSLYRTQDGGESFTEITWPSAKRELPDGSLYNPFVMPEKVWEEDGKLKMLVGQGPEGDYYEDGAWVYGLYESEDTGKNWVYAGTQKGKDTRPK